MGFQEVADLDASVSYALGGRNKKTGKPNPSSIEGYFLGTRQVPSTKSKTGFCALHFFQTAEGNVGVWGKTDLDKKLTGVPAGVMTRVKFTGMQETKNNPMFKYSVAIDKSNTIDVASFDENSSGDTDTGGEDDVDSSGGYEAADGGDDEALADEVQPARPQPPRQAVRPPAANVSRVNQILGQRKAAS
jgi:hypothetical protein